MESTRRTEQTWLTVGSLMIIAVVALAAGLIFTRVVLVPFILAVFLAMVVMPVVDFQVLRCRIPQSLATVFALLIIVDSSPVWTVLINAIGNIASAVKEYVNNSKDPIGSIFDQLKEWHIPVGEEIF